MKIAFIFSGQGSQYFGMGKELYDNYDIVKKTFDEADEALGFKISDICFNENDKLNETEFTQPAILTMSVAVSRLLKEKGINADCYAGLSLGEYSALVEGGVLSFGEAVCLVRKRGRFMTEAVPKGEGAMSAVLSLDAESILKCCENASSEGFVSIANYNAPGQIVVAGETKAVEAVEPMLLEAGAKRAVRLNVSGPFHTPLLTSASDKLAVELDNVSINNSDCEIYTNLTGDIISGDIKDILIKQVMNPVKWQQEVEKMIENGCTLFIEAGPGKTLTSFVKKISKEVSAFNVEDIKSLDKLLAAMEDGSNA